MVTAEAQPAIFPPVAVIEDMAFSHIVELGDRPYAVDALNEGFSRGQDVVAHANEHRGGCVVNVHVEMTEALVFANNTGKRGKWLDRPTFRAAFLLGVRSALCATDEVVIEQLGKGEV